MLCHFVGGPAATPMSRAVPKASAVPQLSDTIPKTRRYFATLIEILLIRNRVGFLVDENRGKSSKSIFRRRAFY